MHLQANIVLFSPLSLFDNFSYLFLSELDYSVLIQAVAHDVLLIHVVIKTLTIKTEATASISTRNSEFACFMLISFLGVLVECKFA